MGSPQRQEDDAIFIFVMSHGVLDEGDHLNYVTCVNQTQNGPVNEYVCVNTELRPRLLRNRGEFSADAFRFLFVTACAGSKH